MNQPPFTNHCLVAIFSVVDSCFPFSVIYICKHDTGGALGLIVTKTTAIYIDGLSLMPGFNAKAVGSSRQKIFFSAGFRDRTRICSLSILL